MIKIAAGEYLYKGYRINRVENEAGNLTSEWDICEDAPGGWVAIDRFGSLRYCKVMIDSWRRG